jgi:hypothetical protein
VLPPPLEGRTALLSEPSGSRSTILGVTDDLDLVAPTRSEHWAAELVERGMDTAHAEMLAGMEGVDLHAVVEALDAGCSPAVAWDIFS